MSRSSESKSVEVYFPASTSTMVSVLSSLHLPTNPDSGGPAIRVLLNNLVLERVAKHLPARDLLQVRLTSTVWNRAFVPELKKTHTTKPLYNEIDEDGRPRSERHFLMGDYIQVMSKSEKISFGRYKVADLTADKHRSNFDEFFSVCGESISKLEFLCDGPTLSESNIDRIRSMVFELSPNLEDLHLDINLSQSFEGLRPALIWQTKVEPVSGHLPNLKRMRLDCNIWTQYLSLSTQFSSLMEDLICGANELKELYLSLKYDTQLQNLAALHTLQNHAKHLDCLRSLTIRGAREDDFRLLAELSHRKRNGLHLHKFVASTEYDDKDWTTMAETSHHAEGLNLFLTTQASTLRRLSLYLRGYPDWVSRASADPGARVSVTLPWMGIKTLSLRGTGQFELQFQGGTLGDAFPQLQRLEVAWNLMDGEGRGEVLQVSQLVHRNVTELTLMGDYGWDWVWSEYNERKLEEISEALPSITRFEAFIPSDHIPQCIWTSWPMLTVLNIVVNYKVKSTQNLSVEETLAGSIELDEWLSGIPKSTHEELEADSEYQNIRAAATASIIAEDRVDVDKRLKQLQSVHASWKSLPGIGDLRFLRQFTLTVLQLNPIVSRGGISDIAGYFGLAMGSPTIEMIVISTLEGQELFSKECKSLVRAVLGPHAVVETGTLWQKGEQEILRPFVSSDLM